MAEPETRRITYDAARRTGAVEGVAAMLRDVARAHPLAMELARRDLKAQYRSAVLGVLWALVVPAFTVGVWIFVRLSGAVEVRGAGEDYAAFLVTGVLLWAILVDAASAPLQQVQSSGNILAKISFPHEALILSGVYQVLFSAGIKLVVMLVALALLGVAPGVSTLALLPTSLALVAIGTLIGVAIAPVGGIVSDVGRALPLALHSLMFLAPVVYPVPRGGVAAEVIARNPATPLIEFGRSAALGQPLPDPSHALVVTGVAVVLLAVSWVMFRAAMPVVVERIGA